MSPAARCQRALLILTVLAATLGLTSPAEAADGTAPAGYWLAGADGKVYRFGTAPELGAPAGSNLNQPVVCMTSTASGAGYWIVARDGGIFAYGDAPFLGSTGGVRLNRPIVGMAATLAGPGGAGAPAGGYWLTAADGGVFSFGNARFFGSTGGVRLNQPIVGMAATPTGQGYWLVARDGGVFAFGDAAFRGSTGGVRLNQPIVGLAATPSGGGYWLAAADGGVFAFGDARFLGSAAGRAAGNPVAGIAGTGTGAGYWLAARDGGVYAYGDAPFAGSAAGATSDAVVGIAPVGRPGGCGGFEDTVDTPVDRIAEASRFAAGRAGTAGFALIDTASGQVHVNGAGGVAMRTASIVKVIIGMRLFAVAAEQRRGLTADEQSNLSAMIRSSDNDAASRLWGALGGPAVINWVRKVTGVRNTAPPANPGSWGFTTTTARDMAVILNALVRAKAATPAHRDALLREMRLVVPSQRWGIAAAVHRSVAAVKNGWYPDTDAPVWRVLCTGVIDHGRPSRWVLVVATRYPANLGMVYGQETCSGIAARALPPDI